MRIYVTRCCGGGVIELTLVGGMLGGGLGLGGGGLWRHFKELM